MGFTSIWHWIIVLLVVLVLFGAGKIPRLMGDVAKGVNAFKKGLREDDDAETSSTEAPKSIDTQSASAPMSESREKSADKG
jgi:sec-independent protein translocase protein TatA